MAPTFLKIETARDDLKRFENAFDRLGYRDGQTALMRAINRTATMARTIVVRNTSKATSIKQAVIRKAITTHPASRGNLEASIVGTGRAIPLKDMGAKQSSRGVRVRIYGQSELNRDMFIYGGTPRSGKVAYQGHVLRNTGEFNPKSGRDNLPYIQFGPSVPGGMKSQIVQDAFDQSIAENMPRRLEHEIERMMK